MIINLDEQRANLPSRAETNLAVQGLMGFAGMCHGPLHSEIIAARLMYYCRQCAYRFRKSNLPHTRVPLDYCGSAQGELLEWLCEQGSRVQAYYNGRFEHYPHRVRLFRTMRDEPNVSVAFSRIAETGYALAIAAVKLLEAKGNA